MALYLIKYDDLPIFGGIHKNVLPHKLVFDIN